MYNASRKDFACLLNIIESISKIQKYSIDFTNADELLEDTKSFDAIMMNFVVIGEMAEKLTNDFISETQTRIDWFKIKGFRNIIAHNYFGIDVEEVFLPFSHFPILQFLHPFICSSIFPKFHSSNLPDFPDLTFLQFLCIYMKI